MASFFPLKIIDLFSRVDILIALFMLPSHPTPRISMHDSRIEGCPQGGLFVEAGATADVEVSLVVLYDCLRSRMSL